MLKEISYFKVLIQLNIYKSIKKRNEKTKGNQTMLLRTYAL